MAEPSGAGGRAGRLWDLAALHPDGAAPEIRGLLLQLSQNNGEAFFWSLLPSPSTTAGDDSPVIQGTQPGSGGLRQSWMKAHPPFISWFL